MKPRSLRGLACGPMGFGVCLCAVVGNDRTGEASQVSKSLAASLRDGCVLEFSSLADIVNCTPAGSLDLLVLTAGQSPAETGELLRWARCNWPGCRTIVLCQDSDLELERVVRSNGGLFFVRSVSPEQWHALLQNVDRTRLGV